MDKLYIRMFVVAKVDKYREEANFFFDQAVLFVEQAKEAFKKRDEALRKADEAESEVNELFADDNSLDFIEALMEQHYRAKKEWREPRFKLEISLKQIEEIQKILIEVEQFDQQQEDEAFCKLSQLQKTILLKIFAETKGYDYVIWAPGKWFSSKTASERAAFSKSLKRLEDRKLVKRHTVRKGEKALIPNLVGLTRTGYRVAKRLIREKGNG